MSEQHRGLAIVALTAFAMASCGDRSARQSQGEAELAIELPKYAAVVSTTATRVFVGRTGMTISQPDSDVRHPYAIGDEIVFSDEVIIVANENVPYGTITRLIDEIERQGVASISIHIVDSPQQPVVDPDPAPPGG